MEWDVIYTYTREQAIADGVLVDVSEMAREAKIIFPVAVTQAVWEGLVIPDQKSASMGQDQEGRLWDIFTMLKLAIRNSPSTNIIRFSVIFVINGKPKTVALKAICGPGDNFEPVLTIMLPDED